MKRFAYITTPLVVLMFASSCAQQYGTPAVHDIGRYLTLKPDVSTKHDVYQQFGQPADVRYAEGTGQWLYLHVNAQIHGATFIPFIGFGAGGNQLDMAQVIFHFRHGRFQRIETSHGSRYQNMWVSLKEDQQSTEREHTRVEREMAKIDRPFDQEAWKQARLALKLRPIRTQ